jgi:GTP-binding protein EngB required for normal cell division
VTLDERLAALAQAAELADGRLPEGDVAAARALVAKAGARLGLGIETTVVALAGPTGAGKSSLFNALSGQELTQVGRRRPTTSTAVAAVWGEGADDLLDWVGVPRRHRLVGEFDGLALLDLPDFDSVESAHRVEVDRLLELVDLVVWVVDPQKYADNAWHAGYLRRLAAYGGSMAVVLNQSDLLAAEELEACRTDLSRLVERDGAADVPILAASAATGDGLPALRRLLAERIEAREAVAARLGADIETVAERFAAACAGGARGVSREERGRLLDALADAAGVATVQHAVERAHRRRGALATGWPYLRWLKRLRPDPLRRLRLGGEQPTEHVHTSLPPASAAQVARAENAARAVAASAAAGLPEPWPARLRAAATPAPEHTAAELDRAVAGADLHVRPPLWWRLVGPLQKLLAIAVAVGVLWLLALLLLDYLRLGDAVPTPEVRDLPLPTALLLGGVVAGVALAFLARVANGIGARRRARAAGRSVRKRVEGAAATLVLDPVEAELQAYGKLCAAVAAATRGGRAPRRTRRGATQPA